MARLALESFDLLAIQNALWKLLELSGIMCPGSVDRHCKIVLKLAVEIHFMLITEFINTN